MLKYVAVHTHFYIKVLIVYLAVLCCFVFPLLVKVHFKTVFLSYKQKLSGAQCHFYGL